MLRGMSDADDMIKGASRFLSKLGGTLKTAGGQIKQTAKQVTGGTLRGRIVLALPEPVEAKRLVVTLRARQKIVTITKTQSGKSVGTSHADVYQFDHELGSARSYESGTIPFELHVPPDALDLRAQSAGGHPLADAVRSVASALSPQAGPIEWEVIGRLEIAWGRDLSKSVDLVVAR
jgi:hypothetical protein